MSRYVSAEVFLLIIFVHFTCAVLALFPAQFSFSSLHSSRSLPCTVLTLFPAQFSFSSLHSHYFHTTVIFDLNSNFALFTETKTLDDVVLYWYDSVDEVVERRVPWFKTTYTNLYQESAITYEHQIKMQNLLASIINYRNQTTGYHILQILQGCSIDDDGAIQGSFIFHYDGKPFCFFNVKTVKFVAETPGAEAFVQASNSNETVLQQNLHILMNTCIPHITELLSLGNCTFSRKEVPVVKVTQIPIDNGTLRVRCRAYGHYPKDISLMWYKNGEQLSEEMMERTTLPLLDLTYLTSLSFNVTSTTDDVYTCKVNHTSMLRDFSQDWRILSDSESLGSAPPSPPIWPVVAICLAVILVIAVITFGSVFFALKRQLHEPFEENVEIMGHNVVQKVASGHQSMCIICKQVYEAADVSVIC
ncbi:major histocompatibility complex class I-related protein 1-like [Anomaloglossus baeobatrachus]|uniref:major histocompatibility complex class I-related protein 1-like n=1 Tax=Anomaloglossus baeobatrachus TaxID=238106 RepID=UPI003F4F9A60